MNERLKEAFDAVHAEEELKEKTKDFVMGRTEAGKKRRLFSFRRFIPAVACLIFLSIAFGSYQLYFIPTSAISIDINPSLELEINRFDKVISVKGYNTDGEKLAAVLDIRFLKYTEAVNQILNSESIADYLAGDEELSITVVSSDGIRCEKMLSDIRHCAEGREKVYCHTASEEDADIAHAAGLSCGKYRAYLELKALDPDITVDEVQGMTMKEIHNCTEALTDGGCQDEVSQDEAPQDEAPQDEAPHGHHHEYGHGRKKN